MVDNNKDRTYQNTIQSVHQVFAPSTPLVRKDQCYGRFHDINRITKSLQEPGKHILLFGGRGYGKTSLANIVVLNLPNYFIIKVNCHRSLNTYSDIWRDIFKKILSTFPQSYTSLKLKKGFETYFSEGEKIINTKQIGIVEVINFFSKVNFPILIVLDEVDLITKEERHLGMLADTIKTLSDQLPWVKLLIIGIAENSNDFIGEHASLERCLVEVKIDRMSSNDLCDILEGGLLKVGIQVSEEVKNNIILFSHGLPYYVHLITLYAIEEALELGYKQLVEKNFHTAVVQALRNMDENLTKSLQTILRRSRGNYEQILNTAMILEERSMAAEYYIFRQDPQYQYHYENIGFSAQMISDHLHKKQRILLDEKKVSRILNLLANTSTKRQKKTSIQILSKRYEGRETRYYFYSPLFRAFLHHRLYEITEVPKPVFFVS